MSRKFKVLGAVAAISMALAACGGSSSSSSDTAAALKAPFSTVASGKLTVCSDAPYEPFEFQDAAGKWTGFDMDIMTTVASRYGLSLEVTKQPFDGIWLAPAAKTCDVVASSMTITPERQQNALFSDPYFDADQSLMVRKDDAATYTTLASLSGKTIAVQTGTTGETYAKANATGAKIQSFDDASAMFLALDSKQVDAILQDLPINAYRALQQGGASVVTATFKTGEQYGFGAAKDNTTLITAINDSLKQFKSDGTYDTIYAKYFGAAK